MEDVEKIRVGITQGDVNGISLEIIMKSLAEPEMFESFVPVIFGSPKAVAYHRKALNIQNFTLNNINEASEAHPKRVNIVTCADENARVEMGAPSQYSGEAAVEALAKAVEALKNNEIDVLVVSPADIKSMQSDAFGYASQIDYIKKQLGCSDSVTMLVGEDVRVAVAIDNVQLSQLSQCVTKERILSKLKIVDAALKSDFTIRRPRIAVLGMNQHAGENGVLGAEELEIISPAIEAANDNGIYAMGPFAADSVFGTKYAFKFDAILAIYGDQGFAPFRTLTEFTGAQYFAGLPVVVSAPVHGNAFDIAGQDKACIDSLRNAIYLAIDAYKNRKSNKKLTSNVMQTHAKVEQERNA